MTADPATAQQQEYASAVSARVRIDDMSWRPGGEVAHSPSLQTDVVAALVRSGYAALAGIGCEVNGERVVLFGAVPTYHLKQLAQAFVQRVDGVGKVINRIAVFA